MGPAPITMAVSPGAMPDRVMPCRETASGSARAAWRAERLSGRRKTLAARTRMYSAKAPSPLSVIGLLRFSHWEGLPSRQRRQVPHLGEGPPTTRSPTRQVSTPSPTAAMVPVHSCPATAPGLKPQPSRNWWMSEPQMPQLATATSTWSGPGRGTGRSSTVMTPGDW